MFECLLYCRYAMSKAVHKERQEETVLAYVAGILIRPKLSYSEQEGQHPLTGQRAANFRRDLEAT